MPEELGEVDRIDDNISYAPRARLFHAELEGMVVGSYATEAEARAALAIHKELNEARDEATRKRIEEVARQERLRGWK